MILWITGIPTAGKTWLDDFLQHYHGWIHIDGDEGMLVRPDEDTTKNVAVAFFQYWMKSEVAPVKLWHPYYRNLCQEVKTVSEQNPNANIVITGATYLRIMRDFLRNQIKENTSQELTYVSLHVSEEEYVKRIAKRTREYAKSIGKTMEEYWKFRNYGEYSESKEEEHYRSQGYIKLNEVIQNDEPNSSTIDVDDKANAVPEISRILNLPSVDAVDAELITQINVTRWKAAMEKRDGGKK